MNVDLLNSITAFSNICCGECFEYRGNVYMRIKYEVIPIKNIQLSELAVLIEDNEPIYLDEDSANGALSIRNSR